MVRKFEDAIKISIRRYDQGRARLPVQIANNAINHFKDSFRKQGFEDEMVKPWKPRRKVDRGRAILVRTGRLRRSFSSAITPRKIVIINDTPYSIYHNEGTKRMAQRRFMGESHVLNEKNGIMIMRMIKRAL